MRSSTEHQCAPAARSTARDPATGLIDFLSELDGEDCYLCWRLGEEDIGYWHGTDEGFGNRKPLPGV